MKIYFAGSGLDAFYSAGGTEKSASKPYATDLTVTSAMDGAPGLVNLVDDTGSSVSLTNLYFQLNLTVQTTQNINNNSGLIFRTANGDNVLRLCSSTSMRNAIQFQIPNASSSGNWVHIGADVVMDSTQHVLDVGIEGIGTATGKLIVYMDNALVQSVTVDLSSCSAISGIAMHRIDSVISSVIHSMIVADALTVGCYIAKIMPATAGTYSDWNGTLTDTAVVPLVTTSGLSSPNTAGKKSTAKSVTPSINTMNYKVAAVVVSAVATITGEGLPVEVLLKQGATESAKSVITEVGTSAGYGVWNTDPTGADWTPDLVGSLEYGIETGTTS